MQMAKITKTDAVWTTVDVETLPEALLLKHKNYKAAYSAMKACRKEFEDAISAAIAPSSGKRVIFGYNFGKLSVAVVDAAPDRKPASAGIQSLADWIASQRATGRNC